MSLMGIVAHKLVVAEAVSVLPEIDWRTEAAKLTDKGVSPYSRLYAARLAWKPFTNT